MPTPRDARRSHPDQDAPDWDGIPRTFTTSNNTTTGTPLIEILAHPPVQPVVSPQPGETLNLNGVAFRWDADAGAYTSRTVQEPTVADEPEGEPWDPMQSGDARLRELVDLIAYTEDDLAHLRHETARAMRHALDEGVTMTHLARVTGWSRQWCHKVITRWDRPETESRRRGD